MIISFKKKIKQPTGKHLKPKCLPFLGIHQLAASHGTRLKVRHIFKSLIKIDDVSFKSLWDVTAML